MYWLPNKMIAHGLLHKVKRALVGARFNLFCVLVGESQVLNRSKFTAACKRSNAIFDILVSIKT